ncbi:MAG: retention module-containing protein, partial [Oceanospirillales bacterium]
MSVQVATVSSITGEAFARQADGTLRPLAEGDSLFAGETLVVNNGSQAVLNFDGNELVSLTGPQELLISETQITAFADDPSENQLMDPSVAALLAALEGEGDLLDDLEAPAAGTEGAPEGGGSNFVRLDRVEENVDPLSFQFSQEFLSPFTIPIGESIGVAEVTSDEALIPPTVTPLGGEVNESGSLDSFTQSLGINLGGLSGTVTLSSPGAVWNPETNTLIYGPDSYGGSWQIQINPDGTYTFTQTGAMEHPNSDDPNDVVPVEVTVTVVSENGLSAESSFIVNILDDGPSIIELNTDAEGLALNVFDAETLLEGGSTDKFELSDLFSVDVDYGTDGPGSVAWTYALGLVQGDQLQLPGEDLNDFPQDSGFNPIPFPIQLPQNAVLSGLTSSGSPIILELSIDQQTITGSIIGEGTDTVFTLAIVDGELILTQFLPIDHLLNGVPVDQLDLANLVTLTGSVTVTDRDGDTVNQSTDPFNLGELITFNDDEPSFDIDDIELGNILLNTSDADIGAEDGNTDS